MKNGKTKEKSKYDKGGRPKKGGGADVNKKYIINKTKYKGGQKKGIKRGKPKKEKKKEKERHENKRELAMVKKRKKKAKKKKGVKHESQGGVMRE